mmetsp:Transcript_101395/g.302390  ORF Transcript_101395/g.302390 Transcript_101395/m.302390 type:complete len:111 (+) Transcript_101395:414-746(+)
MGMQTHWKWRHSATSSTSTCQRPRVFSLCERKAGCAAPELVMVGDSAEKDVRGAQDAGWRAIWVRPPVNGSVLGGPHDLTSSQPISGEGKADATVDHVREVEGILRSWSS